jgi:hypothetical protein
MTFGLQDSTQFKSKIKRSFIEIVDAIEKINLDPYTYRVYRKFLIQTQVLNNQYSESQKSISNSVLISERKIRDCIKVLQKMNMIKIERYRRNDDGHYIPNLITLTDPCEWILENKENW